MKPDRAKPAVAEAAGLAVDAVATATDGASRIRALRARLPHTSIRLWPGLARMFHGLMTTAKPGTPERAAMRARKAKPRQV